MDNTEITIKNTKAEMLEALNAAFTSGVKIISGTGESQQRN